MWRSTVYSLMCLVCANKPGAKDADIRVASFNMNGKNFGDVSKESLNQLLCPKGTSEPDIIVVATQETGHEATALPVPSYTDKQKETLLAHLKAKCKWDGYRAWSSDMGQIAVFAFSRQALQVKQDHLSLGLGGFGRNKGMASMSFKYNGTQYVVAGVHLDAHEGDNKIASRKEQMQKIHARLSAGKEAGSVIIIAGDFNTRAAPDSCDEGKTLKDWPSAYTNHTMTSAEQKDAWSCDELNNRLNDTLLGYNECEILFPPTFKKDNGKYVAKRRPSWTDRIIVTKVGKSSKTTLYGKPGACKANNYRSVTMTDKNKKGKSISDHDAVVLSSVQELLTGRQAVRA